MEPARCPIDEACRGFLQVLAAVKDHAFHVEARIHRRHFCGGAAVQGLCERFR